MSAVITKNVVLNVSDIEQDPGFGDPKFLKKEDAAKKKAWTNFLNHFPKADKSRFISQIMIDKKKT